jgi:hypothetical protein
VTPSVSRYLTAAQPRTQKESEIIDEDEDEDEDDIPFDVHDSIETDGLEQERSSNHGSAIDENDDYKIEEPSPKRRRISLCPKDELDIEGDSAIQDYEESFSSSLPILSSPPAPRPSKAHKFLLSTPGPQFASQSTEPAQTFLKPPRFQPPDPTSTQQARSDPLPEHFSPHRRGQKYLPGGLAAEVRDWLVNLESALPSTSTQRSRTDDTWLVKLLVDDISGGLKDGMTLIRGHQVLSDDEGKMVKTLSEVKAVLAGEGQHIGLQRGTPIAIGKIVGIKAPVWEVMLEGVKWGVGVDWKVLS